MQIQVPPLIPGWLLDKPDWFAPSREFGQWARAAFIDDERSPTYNEEHGHLQQATIGFVLTTKAWDKGRDARIGDCGLGKPSGKPWPSGARKQQIEEWFGGVPDFLINLDATWLSTATPLQTCALVEHELMHAGFKTDVFGQAIRSKETDRLTWEIRRHDAEVFVSEIARYGAWNEGLDALKSAFAKGPRFGPVELNGVCGCGKRL